MSASPVPAPPGMSAAAADGMAKSTTMGMWSDGYWSEGMPRVKRQAVPCSATGDISTRRGLSTSAWSPSPTLVAGRKGVKKM
jgi:hypothetical protein